MINKNSAVPMYEQIASLLKEEILNGNYEPSGNIGTHSRLAERFGVSLITIRKAIAMLTAQGLLDVAQGKGTFVKSTALKDNLSRLTGVENIVIDNNLTTRTEVTGFDVIDTPEYFDTQLRRGLCKKCLRVKLVYAIEGIRSACAEKYLPLKYGEYISRPDLEKYTVYQLYESKWNMNLGKGRQIIRAEAASENVAAALGIPEGWPVLAIERRSFTTAGELVEYMQLYYEYTRYSLEVELPLSSV